VCAGTVIPLICLFTPGHGARYQDEAPAEDDEEEDEHSQIRSGYSRRTQTTLQAMNEQMINFDLLTSLLETICFTSSELRSFSQAILVFLPSLDTIRTLCDLLEGHPQFGTSNFQIYPLHSSISNEQQARVFEVCFVFPVVPCRSANLHLHRSHLAECAR
jgi:ATP-dependent RNA helicase DHX29